MRRESPQPSGQAPPSNGPTNTSDNESGGEKPVRETLHSGNQMTPPSTSMRRESPQPSGQVPPSNGPTNTSDNESGESGGEKPVREKLRDTRIANQAMEEDMNKSPGSSAGKLRRKRSLDDVQDDEDNVEEPGKPGKQARKRSRTNSPDDKMDSIEDGAPQIISNGSRDRRSLTPELSSGRAEEVHPVGLASPKNKRTRDQVLRDEEGAHTPSGDDSLATQAIDTANKLSGDDRQTKRHRDSGSPEPAAAQETTKIPSSSGFANASSTSPFGTLSSNPAKTNPPQTSDTKFASSGFGKLASTSSPFGAAKGTSALGAAQGTSSFGAAKGTSAFASAGAPMKPSAFGPSPGSSAFGGGSAFASGSSTSVFGNGAKTASVFGSGAKTASVFGGSSFAAAGKSGSFGSFAGGSGPNIEGLSNKSSKPFGAAEESDEEPDEDAADDDDEGHKSPMHSTEETIVKKDKRFYEQDVETGEEGEKTLFTSRAKLFSFEKIDDGSSAWKERGSGFIKVNVPDVKVKKQSKQTIEKETETADQTAVSPPKKARLIMRANGTNRLVLNTPLTKELKFGQPGTQGAKPTGKQIMFLGLLDSANLQTMQLSMAPDNAKGLWDTVQQLLQGL
ncbi:Ran binding protein 1 [Venturia nashicola]|uniref:Ran binding protein 1 n=1 Tax=Venturia nashicola TaxID=86259 RepID=A0A4Z1PEL7_9PEZI|nr:Ran binding protein 1 [Venturia nashicola]TLD36277.1 Ran binding protein 1 [Venturia nashicola]